VAVAEPDDEATLPVELQPRDGVPLPLFFKSSSSTFAVPGPRPRRVIVRNLDPEERAGCGRLPVGGERVSLLREEQVEPAVLLELGIERDRDQPSVTRGIDAPFADP